MPPAIAACRAADIAVLERHNPSPGVASIHAARFARQRAKTSTYLVAWYRRVPVGRAEIRWDGCEAAEVRDEHGDCPEINGLEVFPAALRGHGLGSALIAHAEALAAERGCASIGLGVNDTNPDAARLYHRLGYTGELTYYDRYSYHDSLGKRHHVAEPSVFLAKALPDAAGRGAVWRRRWRLAISPHRPLAARHM